MVTIKRKGQAALEFLTTYGWAFLVILVMISALGYFGILNPDRFLPERCNVGPEFACVEYAVYNNGTLIIILSNSVGQTLQDMEVNRIQLRNAIGPATSLCNATSTNGTAIAPGNTIRAGENIQVLCNLNSTYTDLFGSVGGKVRVDLDLTYLALGLSLNRPVSAQIYATLQE
jgi:hypothetical protein